MKIYIISLGCAKNRVDSELVVGLLEKNGAVLIDDPNEADLLMVNTCAFIESARKEAIDTILSLADYKKDNKKLIVLGCLPQRYDNLASLMPEVDAFVSIRDYKDLTNIINNLYKSHYEGSLSFLNKHVSTPNYMRYIKISEGCLNRCAFCAIPLIRGKLKSRTILDIKEEVRQAVLNGAYEINLISQDTTRYGYDLAKTNLIVPLLEELVKIDGNFKIRLLYLYPDIVSDELINFIKNNDKVMPYFDIPIQHSEDSILKSMNRRGNKDYLINLFNKIRKEIPTAIIRTTLIVGFPGETDELFQKSLEFAKSMGFMKMHVFPYSKRAGTPAAKMTNQIDEAVKKQRVHLMQKMAEQSATEFYQRFLGRELEVLFEQEQDGYMEGLTSNYIRVYIKNDEKITSGDIRLVKLVKLFKDGILGELI